MKVLMSAHTNYNNDLGNKQATKQFVRWLQNKGFTFTPCIGVYKGKQETSFLIDVNSVTGLELLKRHSKVLNQECILTMLDNGSQATLLNHMGQGEVLGMFKEVTPYHAKQQDAYTLINGQYFVAE